MLNVFGVKEMEIGAVLTPRFDQNQGEFFMRLSLVLNEEKNALIEVNDAFSVVKYLSMTDCFSDLSKQN